MATKLLRESNIEILRVLAMFFVLIGHVILLRNGYPSLDELYQSPLKSFFRYLLPAVSCVGVDVFILISGWFGIRFSIKGLMKLLFQFLFLTISILAVAAIYDKSLIDMTSIKASVGLYNGYWFVMAYIGLYLLSPLLNAFVEICSERQLRSFLILFYIFQSYYSWLTAFVDYLEGYSIMFFCVLYLTSRYFKLYPVRLLDRYAALFYSGALLFQTVIFMYCWSHYGMAARMIRYDNPLVIFQGLLLLLLFSKRVFYSRSINWIAQSCFAVYIIHFHPLVFRYFSMAVSYIYSGYSDAGFIFYMLTFLIFVFSICILVDKIRLFVWNIVLRG